jgi:hypothetical protein
MANFPMLAPALGSKACPGVLTRDFTYNQPEIIFLDHKIPDTGLCFVNEYRHQIEQVCQI